MDDEIKTGDRILIHMGPPPEFIEEMREFIRRCKEEEMRRAMDEEADSESDD